MCKCNAAMSGMGVGGHKVVQQRPFEVCVVQFCSYLYGNRWFSNFQAITNL